MCIICLPCLAPGFPFQSGKMENFSEIAGRKRNIKRTVETLGEQNENGYVKWFPRISGSH